MFTAEQDTIIVMAHFRSGTRNPDGTWSYSLQSCIDQFNEYFPEANFTYDAFRQHFSNWGTPIVPIHKKHKSVKICGDFKVTINPVLNVDNWVVAKIVKKLGSKFFLVQVFTINNVIWKRHVNQIGKFTKTSRHKRA
ncbi:hypothetical protein RN001_004963 [Aquatica leii]|uniref:Uncharacterized protein n=1 Tax=Aquatica leii TaxID=1421715 RepID=A0AAN7PZ52_9COLE|nr:hypothetical protein RN001_004963 [Aquatica leii]